MATGILYWTWLACEKQCCGSDSFFESQFIKFTVSIPFCYPFGSIQQLYEYPFIKKKSEISQIQRWTTFVSCKLLPPFQIIRRFGISMHLDIYLCLIHCKINESRKAKTSYNLEQEYFFIVKVK